MNASIISQLSSFDIAIDLGTYKTSIFVRGEGIVLEEPTLICLRNNEYVQGSVIAIGDEARSIYGKEPENVITVKPLRGGVVEHLEATKLLIKSFARKAKWLGRLRKPNVLISAPFAISNIERRAVRDVAASISSRSIGVIEEPIAAAIGCDLDIGGSQALMVVDAGWGITEAAVISLGGIVHCESERVGGEVIVHSIIEYFKKAYALQIGERTAASIMRVLSDFDCDFENEMSVRGMDVASRLPMLRHFKLEELRGVIQTPLASIVRTIKRTLENTPPMLSADLIENGIVLTGGTALLKDFDTLIESHTGIPVRIAQNPHSCVIRGGGSALDYLSQFKLA
ncbi:MAG: rod shape-determining protein [Proteobacteria bacterium]|nr:MAG: rod shape-determining protein [Pseudomonadota bacterium]